MRSKAVFEVNIDSFKNNLKLIQQNCPKSNILLMVKADAYGHGAIEITRHAIEYGVKSFGLATVKEALLLRLLNPDPLIDFYAFSETELDDLRGWKDNYLRHNLIPVIESLDKLDQVLKDSDFKKQKIALKVNIGMNRFGLRSEEIEKACQMLRHTNRDIYHLIAHLPCSPDLRKIDETRNQVNLFSEIKNKIESSGIKVEHSSISNSGAIERGLGLEHDYVRPGLMAYGCLSTKDNPMGWKGKIISSLKAKPLKIFSIKEGEVFGYGGTSSPADGQVAVLPLGYADGLTQNYSTVEFKWSGKIGKIIGYVNMDICYVLFQEPGQQGDWIEVWGSSPMEFAQLAKKTQTITYQLLCQISQRVPRLYKMS